MGKTYGNFKYDIGQEIKSFNRNLIIVGREYRTVIRHKNGKDYNLNQKWYNYKCRNCGNLDWIIEHSLDERSHSGCNVCCHPPRKIVKGVNDIYTTANWLVKYLVNKEDAYNHSKYSKDVVEMKCPHCGLISKKQIHQVVSNNGLSCVCKNGMSYPNKFMYALLIQLDLDFEIEKRFEWSEGRVYDDYIKYNNLTIITEQHGKQHYFKPIGKRTVGEERSNDIYKKQLAKENGIDYYFEIDCSESKLEYIKNSIICSGLLKILNVSNNDINWNECDNFAISNTIKEICFYKSNNPHVTLHQIANIYKLSYQTILRYIKIGNKFGWCDYKNGDDVAFLNSKHLINHGEKPIFCLTNGKYYRCANDVGTDLSIKDKIFYPRQIRQSINRNQKYFGYKFKYITKEEFNKMKLESPSKVVGDFFNIKV